MWGENSMQQNCENDCQCSGLITENFKINSGNNATKRKQETAFTTNYKNKMNPHCIDFASPIHSPKATPSKRRVLGELQNYSSSSFKAATPSKRRILGEIQNFSPSPSPLSLKMERLSSPTLERLKNSPMEVQSPKSIKSPMMISPLASLASPLMNSPIIASHSPLTTHSPLTIRMNRTSKISRIFEERTKFKMDKENFSSFNTERFSTFSSSNSTESYETESYETKSYETKSYETKSYEAESYLKFDLEETARDFSFGERFQAGRERMQTWSTTKLDFTNALPTPVPADQDLDDLRSLQDLEEFDTETFDTCTKYEIISTDSPDVISRGRSTTRKICSRNFEFGAPLSDSEASTSFPRPATRMLNFDEDFEFTSPAVKKTVSVKKSLKFNEVSELREPRKFSEDLREPRKFGEDLREPRKFGEELREPRKFGETRELSERTLLTPTRMLSLERSDSGIGSMSYTSSPKLNRVYTSESTTSMESGFISELDEPFLDLEESNSPKIANFNDLLSGQIKDNVMTDRGFMKRPSLARSLSFHPESKAKVALLSILETPSEEKRKREEDCAFGQDNKRRRSNCEPAQRAQRPLLQRAFSENNATIKSALARSSLNADLIGDYSGGYCLPLVSGDHSDLKSVTVDTLGALLRGEYAHTVPHYQIIDCRYPYEFEGGHIDSAVNLYTSEQIQALVQQPNVKKTVLILHCEFSIERGPKLSRTLRSLDRAHNRSNYPSLTYPEVYLLAGGYRAFHAAHPALCAPRGYTPMLDPQHRHLLRRHRSIQGKGRLLM